MNLINIKMMNATTLNSITGMTIGLNVILMSAYALQKTLKFDLIKQNTMLYIAISLGFLNGIGIIATDFMRLTK
jgi:hypothetical protein